MKRFSFKTLFLGGFILVFAANPSWAQQVHALWGFSPTGPFSGTMEETIAALQDNGVNAIFANKVEPELMTTLQAAGIKVYTTVSVFGDHSVWKRYPRLRPVDRHGNHLPAEYGSGICPTQRWYWRRILRKVANRRDAGFDGVWLDFIRFSTLWEEPNPTLKQTCFCDSTLVDFSRVTGIEFPQDTVVVKKDSLLANAISPDSANGDHVIVRSLSNREKAAWILKKHRRAWWKYKTGVISDFVAAARKVVNRKPNMILGLFAVPWKRNEFNYAMLYVIGQDYRQLRKHVDVFSPMLYHELAGRSTDWIPEFVQYTAKETNKPVWPIIQSDLGDEHRVPDDEFAAAVLGALEPPSAGVIIFKQESLVEAIQLRVLRSAWR